MNKFRRKTVVIKGKENWVDFALHRCYDYPLVRGNTIRARHLGRDVLAFLRHIVGGEIRDYTKMMAESREQAIDRMIEEACGLGANAIINVCFTTSMIMQSASEILAYGTGVIVE